MAVNASSLASMAQPIIFRVEDYGIIFQSMPLPTFPGGFWEISMPFSWLLKNWALRLHVLFKISNRRSNPPVCRIWVSKGNKFMLANNLRGNAYVAARLDRALWNAEWHSAFSNPLLAHLPKYLSDHSPLLLSHKQQSSPVNVPFEFEAM